MRRRSGWERSPGWVVQGVGTAVLLVLTGLGVCIPGAALVWVSHVFGGPPP